MKKVLLILFVFVIASGAKQSHGQTNVYHPFPDSNLVWTEIGATPSTHSPILYAIWGDTVINSLTYHKIYWRYHNSGGDTLITPANSTLSGAIRNDSLKKVFYYPFSSNCTPNKEYKLYDFSKTNVGDTIQFYTSIPDCYALPYLTIDTIDSVLIDNNTYRKRFSFQEMDETWIEGIGSVRSVFSSIIGYPTCFCVVELVCFKYNDTTLYHNAKYFDCWPQYYTSVEEYLKTNFIISPNPFSTHTTLQTNNLLKNATLTVHNCFGQQVKQLKNINGQTVVLSRDNLPSGLYFLRITPSPSGSPPNLGGDKEGVATEKLVITD